MSSEIHSCSERSQEGVKTQELSAIRLYISGSRDVKAQGDFSHQTSSQLMLRRKDCVLITSMIYSELSSGPSGVITVVEKYKILHAIMGYLIKITFLMHGAGAFTNKKQIQCDGHRRTFTFGTFREL